MTAAKMTNDNSPTDNSWSREADSLWQQGDRQGAINKVLGVITANLPQLPRSASLQFAYYLFQLQDYAVGERVLEIGRAHV